MKKSYLIVLACAILLLSIKVNTHIYIGDYSGNTRYDFDVKIKIDDKEGIQKDGRYWLTYILGDVAVGYANVPDVKKEYFQQMLHSIQRLNEL